MSGYYLCAAKKARRPYYVSGMGINLYTIEELCFYIRQNIYLIDEMIINEELCLWIQEELELVRLAAKLREQLKKSEKVTGFIMYLFRDTGYLSSREYRHVMDKVSGMEVQPENQRRKLKADHLVERGIYSSAINEYYKILHSRNPGSLGTKFFASVLDNMAVAYARQFLFEEAADCLWQSYGIVRSGETWRRYLALLPLYLSKEKYQERLAELTAAPEQVAKIEQQKKEILEEKKAAGHGDIKSDKFLKEEKDQYRRSAGFG